MIGELQGGDVPETQKKILFSFRIMSRSFADSAKSEENFQILDQLKDANVWRILSNLIDPNTSFHQACNLRVRNKLLYRHLNISNISPLSSMGAFLSMNWTYIKSPSFIYYLVLEDQLLPLPSLKPKHSGFLKGDSGVN